MRALMLIPLLVACGGVQRPGGGSGLLPVGSHVPELWAEDQTGETVELVAPLDQWVVLYFYPKDGTPGCTKEACAFRDAWDAYDQANVEVIGVSSDSAESHREFAQEHGLPFSLVADTDNRWARAFGVPSLVGMYDRVTFLLDPDGKVAHVYTDIEPGLHAKEVLRDLEALGFEAAVDNNAPS